MSVVLEWQAKSITGEWFGIVDQITTYTLLRETLGRLQECADAGIVKDITLNGERI